MKKIYTLVGAIAIALTSNAQYGILKGNDVKVAHQIPNNSNLAAKPMALLPGDTINWSAGIGDILPEFASTGFMTSLGYTGGGWVFGNNKDQVDKCAQVYYNLNATPIGISEVLFSFIGKTQTSSGSSNLKIEIYTTAPNKAWNETSPSSTVTAQNLEGPDVLLTTATIPVANVDTTTDLSALANHLTSVTFTTPAQINGTNFAIAIDARTSAGRAAGDTVGLWVDDTNDPNNVLDATLHFFANKWYATDYLFGGLATNLAIFPIVDAYTAVNEFVNGVKMTAVYPNPTSDKATISYDLENASNGVSLKVFNLTGQVVFEQNYGSQAAGKHSVTVDMSNYASGNYYYQLRSNGNVITKKLVVSK